MPKPGIYAIDYGTSNSLINAASHEEVWSEIPIDRSSPESSILKSMIYCYAADDWNFGEKAIERYLDQPTQGRIFKSLKRFLPDPTFKGTTVFGEFLTIQDLIAKQLRFMRHQANEFFDSDVDSVVMGCPALFSDNEESHQIALDRLRAATLSAGFKHVEFCPEPIAAAYKFRQTLNTETNVLVADFGGGTSDFTVLRMSRKRFDPSDVLSLGGISIAGDKYDSDIMRDLISPFLGSKITYKKPMTSNHMSFPKALIRKISCPADIVFLNTNSVMEFIRDAQRYITDPNDEVKLEQLLTVIQDFLGYAIFREIEKCKIQLSSHDKTRFAYHYPSVDIETDISDQEFRQSSADNTRRILACLDEVIAMSGLNTNEIDIVCLTGGTAFIPAIREELVKRFQEKVQLSNRFHSVVNGLVDRGQALV